MNNEVLSLEKLKENGIEAGYKRESEGTWFHNCGALSNDDLMFIEMVEIFQPQTTVDVYKGRVYVDGE